MLKFSNTFLNLESSIKTATDPVIRKYNIGLISIAAIVLGVFPYLTTLMIDYTRSGWTREQINAQSREIARETQGLLEDRLKKLEDNNKIEERVKAMEEKFNVLSQPRARKSKVKIRRTTR